MFFFSVSPNDDDCDKIAFHSLCKRTGSHQSTCSVDIPYISLLDTLLSTIICISNTHEYITIERKEEEAILEDCD